MKGIKMPLSVSVSKAEIYKCGESNTSAANAAVIASNTPCIAKMETRRNKRDCPSIRKEVNTISAESSKIACW